MERLIEPYFLLSGKQLGYSAFQSEPSKRSLLWVS